jgi:hypothetical protein
MSNSCRRQQCILLGTALLAHCPADAQFGSADRIERSVVVQLISLEAVVIVTYSVCVVCVFLLSYAACRPHLFCAAL